MKWKDEYAIGIPELDNQHETLIEFLTVLPKITSWLFQHIIDSDKPFARYAIDSHPDLACAGIK